MAEERLRDEVARLEREVASLRRNRDADRAGRTRAERVRLSFGLKHI
jgi:septal ring factor EnvC (AmiA/AmiB activator)